MDGLAELVGERTRGNPFFVEEVVQSLVEEGRLEGERGAYRLVAPVVDAAVPATVQATLAARIDRLEPRAKAVLQAAAVIGREFDAPVLERVVGLEPAELEGVLGRLVAGELVQERAPGPEGSVRLQAPADPGGRLPRAAPRPPGRRARRGRPRARRGRPGSPRRARRAARRALGGGRGGRWRRRGGTRARPCGPGRPRRRRRWRTGAASGSSRTSCPKAPESVALGLTARMLGLQYSWRMGLAPEEAEAAFREAHRLAVRAGDVRSQAILLNGYGAARGVGDGEVREFARLQREAIALAEAFEDPALYVSIAPGSYALICTGAYREAVATVRPRDRAVGWRRDARRRGELRSVPTPGATGSRAWSSSSWASSTRPAA